MSIGQITIADAARGVWRNIWKGFVWALCVMAAAYALGIEWNWRVALLCIISSFIDFLIYSPTRADGKQS